MGGLTTIKAALARGSGQRLFKRRGKRGAGSVKGRDRITWRLYMLAAFAALYFLVVTPLLTQWRSSSGQADAAASAAGTARQLSSAAGDCTRWADQGAGWAILYMVIVLYLFVGLAIICDDFFVPSLEIISETLKLSEDVAGATFMAAGSSAPELFTSVADSFGPANSMGIGTIVGSAMFNILVIVALSAAAARSTLKIDWRPLMRDVTFYTLSIVAMYLVILDGEATWWEGLIMIGCYLVYVLFMTINQRVFSLCDRCAARAAKIAPALAPSAKQLHDIEEGMERMVEARRASQLGSGVGGTNGSAAATSGDAGTGGASTPKLEDGAVVPMTPKATEATTDVEPLTPHDGTPSKSTADPPAAAAAAGASAGSGSDAAAAAATNGSGSGSGAAAGGADAATPNGDAKDAKEGGDDDDEEDEGLWSWPNSWADRLVKIVLFPFLFFFTYTIPPCGEEKWAKWYIVSFAMSILWIGALCWGMVEFASRFGCIAGIDPPIMGVVVLAVGTSIPDAMGSMIVARQGEADMAIANAVGSNVFDILLGLGLPWFLASVAINSGNPNIVDTAGIGMGIAILVGTVILFVAVIMFNRFRMNSSLGWIFLALYFLFLAYTLLSQYCVLPSPSVECPA